MIIGGDVVHHQRVLALVFRVDGGIYPVVAGVTDVRRRIGIEKSQTIGAALAWWNDVVRIILAGVGIYKLNSFPIKNVARIQQFAEVSGPHEHGRHFSGDGVVMPIAQKFLPGKEEQLFPPFVEVQSRNVDRTAEVPAELVEAECLRMVPDVLRIGGEFAHPAVGVEEPSAQIYKERNMKLS